MAELRGRLSNLSGAHLIGTLDALRAAMSASEKLSAAEGGATAGHRKARA